MVHLSRLAEEMVLWSTDEFGFIRLSDDYTTGSSIMPQKRNPDFAELARGKTGRVYGNLVSLLTTLKALPLTYNRDMQEDKEQVFDAADHLMLALAAMTGMLSDLTANRDRLEAAASAGFSTATDLADWLVREAGVPFREAHHITGAAVARADAKGCALAELTADDLAAIDPRVTPEALLHLSLEGSVASRQSYGGTAPDQVRKQVKAARKALGLDT